MCFKKIVMSHFHYHLSKILSDINFDFLTDAGFPGGAAIENPPANAVDTGSSPGPGRSHMPQSNQAHVPQLLSLCSRTHETQLLKPMHLEPMLRNKRSHCNEKPAHCNEK